jgi:hypothetical protein
LFAIAELAGPNWVAKAHAAALALSGRRDVQDDTFGLQLLAAIKDLIEGTGATSSGEKRVTSAAIVAHLLKDETGPWKAFGKAQKEITAAQVADLLKPYEIKPGRMRVDGDPNKRGYEFAAFKDAFEAYLPHPPDLPATPATDLKSLDNLTFQTATPDKSVAGKKSEKPSDNNTVAGVAVQREGETPSCRYCTGPADGSEVTRAVAGVAVTLHEKCVDGWMEASKTMTPDEMLQTYR